MAVTTTRRRTTSSITKYWGMVKDLDDSMKLELISLLAESIKPAKEITTGRQNKKRAHLHDGPDFCLFNGLAYPFISLIRRRLAKGRTAK